MKQQPCYILAIESSCDDTAAAILRNDEVLSNIIATQDVHKQYGGVVPELASRAHQQNIVPVVDQALEQAGISASELNAIAFTQGPGLMGSLLVGTSFAKSLAYGLNRPLVDVNHMQAHILAHFIEKEGYEKPEFPFLAMTISGGHTQIVRVDAYFKMTLGNSQYSALGSNPHDVWTQYLTNQHRVMEFNDREIIPHKTRFEAKDFALTVKTRQRKLA